jgi:poly-beta-hydroxyalkanoate depolymerase
VQPDAVPLYDLPKFQNYSDIVGPVRAIAEMTAAALAQPLPGISRNAFLRAVAAIYELIARAG